MAGRIYVWTSRKRRVLLMLLFRSFAWNFHRSVQICAFVRNWPDSRLRECGCSLYLFCHNFLQSQPEFTLAGRSYQCTSSADPCLPTSTFDCWTTSVEHISQRENTLLQPFRLRGLGCLRFLLSSNRFVFVFRSYGSSAYLITMRRSVSNSPNTLLDIQRALQAKRLAEVLAADETESETQQQETVTTK